jgi:hypothetical protein
MSTARPLSTISEDVQEEESSLLDEEEDGEGEKEE